ncbi:endonuclease/exonuclease/phosphatase family protein [Mesonia sp. K7]|uniref:endonuclease/exonuclease/phosphatase family protein n=1 Tax=Mesonia sp. K7 TaxID=2218606 RepID=UPI000DA7D526|nr:endonuclease/exonuclease/phosphatase family protein [Mesonia sp. K7]PZD78285.1 endonuclease [Mesonia sp. K7]
MIKKRRLGFFNKVLFFFNSLFAVALLFAYLLPYIPPKTFPFLSILSLGMPLLLLINILFLAYWVIQVRRQFLLSAIVLLIGFNHLISLYKFSDNGMENKGVESLKVMSYNVRLFNQYKWSQIDSVPEKISAFIANEDPDILVMQDFQNSIQGIDFSTFKHKNFQGINPKSQYGLAVFSKYPIINQKNLDFKNSGNNTVYVDLKIMNDTIRVFNVHLQSLKIIPKVKTLNKEEREMLITRVGNAFKMQEEQSELILNELRQTNYPSIIAGDFNNSAFSYVYRKLTENHNDAFREAGNGLGKTFDFDFIPLRIDFILSSPEFIIKDFTSYPQNYSDHYPISAEVIIDK